MSVELTPRDSVFAMTTACRRLINGSAYALVVELDHRRRPCALQFVRKLDGVVLETMSSVPVARRLRKERSPSVRAPDAKRELTELLGRLAMSAGRRGGPPRPPFARDWLSGLAVPADVIAGYGLPRHTEPLELVESGRDHYGRPLWLEPAAARGWQRMRQSALDDGIPLQAVSGFRSAAYQHGLIARKRARGQSWPDILAVSALPGYSEHHLGTTLDLHAGDGPALEESFEQTDAFTWLQANAFRYGFHLSYPRGNPYGIAYEPWHWRYHGPIA